MDVKLSDHFDFKRLLKFVLPSIIMMIFASIYSIVDGFFVSNFVGKEAFTAVNLIMPALMIISGIGFIFGTGGSAIVSKTLGEGDEKRARKYFSLIVYAAIVLGIILSAIGFAVIGKVAELLGAKGAVYDYCVLYGKILLIGSVGFILQNTFQSLLVTANRPDIGLKVTIAAGCCNIILDLLFVGVFKWGIIGAATATVVSQWVGGGIPLIYFVFKRNQTLYLSDTSLDLKVLTRVFTNGLSEFTTNIAMSVTSMCYNFQLLKYLGDDGVAAYGVVMYVGFIFVAIFIGFSVGTAPIVGFNYGAKNREELNGILKKSIGFNVVSGAAMLILAQLSAGLIARLYAGYDQTLCELTTIAMRIYGLSFLVSGLNIFSSGFFTALNNGFISAMIALLRTFIFPVACVFILPAVSGVNAIWFAAPIAEVLALCVSIVFLVANKKRYGY